jgi:hypothetical protein
VLLRYKSGPERQIADLKVHLVRRIVMGRWSLSRSPTWGIIGTENSTGPPSTPPVKTHLARAKEQPATVSSGSSSFSLSPAPTAYGVLIHRPPLGSDWSSGSVLCKAEVAFYSIVFSRYSVPSYNDNHLIVCAHCPAASTEMLIILGSPSRNPLARVPKLPSG